MPVTKEFKTIMAEVSGEIVIKGSRFIAHATPVSAQSAAAEFIASISQRFHDATHNCFAWKIGLSDAAVFRFSDAGEPSGTAGRPILQAAETRDLTDLAVVVTRYFGGTKLGTGGLIRAYSAATLAALEQAEIIISYPQITVTLKFAYAFTNAVHQVVEKHGAKILETGFDNGCIYRVRLNTSEEAEFYTALQDATGGKMELI